MIIEEIGNAKDNTLSSLSGTMDSKDYPSSPDEFPAPPPEVVSGLSSSVRCLDIGCSYGYLGNWLKKNKKATVDGIDINKSALRYNKQSRIYKNTYNIDLDNLSRSFTWKRVKNNGYKYIFLFDVIEHLKDPGTSLIYIIDKLEYNGEIRISLPNICHMDIVIGLLEGKFNYNKFGLLDETHLRYFTIGSFNQFIDNLNEILASKHVRMEVKHLGNNTKSTQNVEQLKKKHPKLFKEIENNFKNQHLYTVQHFISLKKRKL